MYYNDYEDYMRSVLGYSNTNDNTYCGSCNYGMNYGEMDYNSNYRNTISVSNVEQMYPEIYKIINPMVCRICDNNTQPITEYMIEQMTDDIYDNVVNRVEVQNIINLNISTRKNDDILATKKEENREDVKENRETRSGLNKNSNISSTSVQNKNNINYVADLKQNDTTNINTNRLNESEERETRSPYQRRNSLLRDLIRILVINRIIRNGRPGQNRPPFRPGPGPRPGQQPGIPGRPGFGPSPMEPRPQMGRYYDYEW